MLESYNRRFGDKFPNPKPSLLEFGMIVDKETDEWVTKSEYAQIDVFKNARSRREIEWPRVPSDFEQYEPPKKKKKCTKKKK